MQLLDKSASGVICKALAVAHDVGRFVARGVGGSDHTNVIACTKRTEQRLKVGDDGGGRHQVSTVPKGVLS